MGVATAPAFRFNGKTPHAKKVAERTAAAMVTRVTEQTRSAIRAVVVKSIDTGVPPYDAARLIRSLVGLTEKQAAAAETYRSVLIDQGLSLDKANDKSDRYVSVLLNQRALTIARTETMLALNTGALEAAAQAQDEGLLSPDAVKEWITTPDEKLCPVCEPMDGAQVKLAEKFATLNGPLPGPPGHPRCRCAVAYSEPDR